jgi:hypothetical protein
VQLTGTSVRALLRPAAGADLELYPNPPGLGQFAQTAVTQALPLVLDALAAATGDDVAGRAGAIVRATGDALGLRTAAVPVRFDGARLSAFAADPAAGLVGGLPTLTAAALAALATALDPVLPAGAAAAVVGDELRVTVGSITVGWRPAPFGITVGVAASGVPLAETVAGTAAFDDRGLAALVVDIGPGDVDAGIVRLRPVLSFAVGASPPGGRRVDLGLAVDAVGSRSIRARWDLGTGSTTLVVDDAGVPTSAPAVVATALLEVVLDLAASTAMTTTAVQDLLDGPVGATTVRSLLAGVLLDDADPTALDAGLFDPTRLLTRLQRLLANLAGIAPTLAIPGGLTIGLELSGTVVRFVAAIVGRADLTSGDLLVSVEADSRWIRGTPSAGLAIGVVDTAGGDLAFAPSLACTGLGLRISRSSGPLLATAVTLGSVAVHLFGSIGAGGVAGGLQLQLSDLAVGTGAAAGGNAIASGMLADANASGEELAPAFSPAIAVQKHPDSGVLVSLSAGEGSGPWWLSIQSGFGPLYVEQVGFGVTVAQEQLVDISLLLDARVSLFGLSAAVDDLEITYVVASGGLTVDLAGLALAADISGISLAGGLRKFGSGDEIEYVGMLLGRFAVYGLSVYGGYGTGVEGGASFASFFAFGAVNGPIGGPPAFFLTGIGGGLGINRGIEFPTDLSRFGEFPFIKALDPAAAPSSDPMAELAEIRGHFPAQRGQFWFAAGISFTSFALVDGVAVVAIEVGDGLEIALLGLARMALPRPQLALVSIELGLIARFSSVEGVLWIQAQLTDNSWLLDESIRLTGGFAFVTWFAGPKAGEFVLTMGGYHPSFHRDGYPQVPRLGFVWEVSGAIVIKGESYFALTSEALMAGGSFEVSARFGPAWARLTFGADGIVYFDPFRFEVVVYVRISAGVTIDVWIGEITIKVSLGARVTVAGPKIRGSATFEVGPVGVTVAFGDTAQHPKTFVSWAEFAAKYLEEASPGVARVLSSIVGKGALPPGTGPSGGEAGTADGSAAHPFEVLGEFELTVVTTVPTRTFRVGGTTRTGTPSGVIGIAPVNVGAATTEVTLRMLDSGGADRAAALVAGPLLTGSFPAGVWGPPQSDEDRKVPAGRGHRRGERGDAARPRGAAADPSAGDPLPPDRVGSPQAAPADPRAGGAHRVPRRDRPARRAAAGAGGRRRGVRRGHPVAGRRGALGDRAGRAGARAGGRAAARLVERGVRGGRGARAARAGPRAGRRATGGRHRPAAGGGRRAGVAADRGAADPHPDHGAGPAGCGGAAPADPDRRACLRRPGGADAPVAGGRRGGCRRHDARPGSGTADPQRHRLDRRPAHPGRRPGRPAATACGDRRARRIADRPARCRRPGRRRAGRARPAQRPPRRRGRPNPAAAGGRGWPGPPGRRRVRRRRAGRAVRPRHRHPPGAPADRADPRPVRGPGRSRSPGRVARRAGDRLRRVGQRARPRCDAVAGGHRRPPPPGAPAGGLGRGGRVPAGRRHRADDVRGAGAHGRRRARRQLDRWRSGRARPAARRRCRGPADARHQRQPQPARLLGAASRCGAGDGIDRCAAGLDRRRGARHPGCRRVDRGQPAHRGPRPAGAPLRRARHRRTRPAPVGGQLMVAAGHFRLHARAEPPLGAGDYRLTADQTVTGGVTEQHVAHVRVTSPRFRLPPDQILSTWPAANEEGAFESRLPQIVIRRRTLPWERVVDADRAVPGSRWS